MCAFDTCADDGNVSTLAAVNLTYTPVSSDPFYYYPWIPPCFWVSSVFVWIYVAAFGFMFVNALMSHFQNGQDVIKQECVKMCCFCVDQDELSYVQEEDEKELDDTTVGSESSTIAKKQGKGQGWEGAEEAEPGGRQQEVVVLKESAHV